jgi:hypothetical protein
MSSSLLDSAVKSREKYNSHARVSWQTVTWKSSQYECHGSLILNKILWKVIWESDLDVW